MRMFLSLISPNILNWNNPRNSFALRFGFLTTILGMIWLGIMAIWLHDYKTNAGKMQMKIIDNHSQQIGAGF